MTLVPFVSAGSRLRAAIATARTLLTQLQTAATDAMEIDTRIKELEAAAFASREGDDKSSRDTTEQLEVARLRLQRDRKLAACAALKSQLEAMNAATLFCASERELAQVTRFAKLVQKKQVGDRLWTSLC